jgi:hypothetical protein
MITLNAFEARLMRNKLRELSCESYVEKEDVLSRIPFLKSYQEEQFLCGIYKSEGTWTVLSTGSLYASYDDSRVILKLETEGDKIHNYFGRAGTKLISDVELEDGKRIWMKSVEVCCAMRNTILMLQTAPK